MELTKSFSEEQLILLEEALNIGAGNAVTALSQMLLCDVEMSFPLLQGFGFPLPDATLNNFMGANTRIEMSMVGELKGGLVVIIRDEDEIKITDMLREARIEQQGDGVENTSLIVEIANILAGVFLTAIHDFCDLHIYHSVPVAARGFPLFLINQVQQSVGETDDVVLLVTNEFSINKFSTRAYLMVILSQADSLKLVNAIEKVKIY